MGDRIREHVAQMQDELLNRLIGKEDTEGAIKAAATEIGITNQAERELFENLLGDLFKTKLCSAYTARFRLGTGDKWKIAETFSPSDVEAAKAVFKGKGKRKQVVSVCKEYKQKGKSVTQTARRILRIVGGDRRNLLHCSIALRVAHIN